MLISSHEYSFVPKNGQNLKIFTRETSVHTGYFTRMSGNNKPDLT